VFSYPDNATRFRRDQIERRVLTHRKCVAGVSLWGMGLCFDREEFLFTYAPLIGPHVGSG
jgi:hypothetical protein